MEKIISMEEIINSESYLEKYDFIVKLLNKAIEIKLVSEEVAEGIAVNIFSAAALLVKKHSIAEGYINEEAKEQGLKNYFHIVNLFLATSYKPYNAYEKLFNEPLESVCSEAVKWFENKLIECYQIFDRAEQFFSTIPFDEATNYSRFMKKMYKVFSTGLFEYDFREMDISSVAFVLDGSLLSNVASIVYNDMLQIGKANLNLDKYIAVSKSMEYELKFLRNFDIAQLKEVIKWSKEKRTVSEEVDGIVKEFQIVDYMSNLTAVTFRQLLFSTTYNEESSNNLKMTLEDAKMVILEAFSGMLDIDEMYRNVEKITWYGKFSEEEKLFFKKLKPEILSDIEDIKSKRIIRAFYIS